MKISCSRGALAAASQTLSRVGPTRTPKAILQNAKLEASKGQVVLIGTDQEVGIRYRLNEADVEAAGEVLLPTNRVLAILREMQGDAVTIESTDWGTIVRGGRAHYQLWAESTAGVRSV